MQDFGHRYKRQAVIKRFKTEDGLVHEFTTVYKEGSLAAGVVALTPNNRVITVYQFRPGPEQWVYEVPGGGIDEGEDHQEGALRELKEETGYTPGSVEYLGESHGDAYTNVTWHYYFATNCVLTEEGPSLDHEEGQQGAEVHLISIADFINNAKRTAMTDPRAVLMAYDKLKELEGKV